jgi:hypothetical protein
MEVDLVDQWPTFQDPLNLGIILNPVYNTEPRAVDIPIHVFFALYRPPLYLVPRR